MFRSLVVSAFLTAMTLASTAQAVPTALPYVGQLSDDAGTPLSADVTVTATLYAAEAGGDPIWGPHDFGSVTVDAGLFTVVLGAAGSPTLDADVLPPEGAWLSLTLDGTVMSPRLPMRSVPYALRAQDTDRLGGEPAASFVTDGELPDLTGYVQAASLSSVAASGAYADLSGTPDLSGYAQSSSLSLVATSGQYADLSGRPDLSGYAQSSSLSLVATSGAYADLSGRPDLSGYAQSSSLAPVATSGQYADLSGAPDLSAYAQSSSLAPVATSGQYADLSDTPDLTAYLQADGTVSLSGPWDAAGQPVENLVVAGGTTPPPSPAAGQLWWDEGTGEGDAALKVWTGTEWLALGQGGSVTVSAEALPTDGLSAVSNGTLGNIFGAQWASEDVPVAIPDNYPPGVDASFTVTESGALRWLTVSLVIDHPTPSELSVTLTAPGGEAFVLYDGAGGGDMGDAGGLARSYPPALAVSGDLSALVGGNPAGTWTLHVTGATYSGGAPGDIAGNIVAFELSYEVLRDDQVAVSGQMAVSGEMAVSGRLLVDGADVGAQLEALRGELWCLRECDPTRLGDCKGRTCDGVAQSCVLSGDLPDGTACGGGAGRCAGGTCCVPTTCFVLGAECGLADGGCGGVLSCGACGGDDVCHDNQCCLPQTCQDLGRQCGTWDDGCGGQTADCGSCGSDYACDAQGQCEWLGTCGGTSCPSLAGYVGGCNAQDHCEYTASAAAIGAAPWRSRDVWIWVPPGSFEMGAPSGETNSSSYERPVHTLTIAQGYFISKYELTVAAYEACESASACSAPSVADWDVNGWGLNRSGNGRSDHPQNGVTWTQAREVCAWVAATTVSGDGSGRLPSESEWAYAASGPVHRRYPWGDSPDPTCGNDTAVFDEAGTTGGYGCGTGGTWAVGSKPAGTSAVGALDMAGNLWEWNEDCWHDSYSGAPTDASAWNTNCSDSWYRLLRGGAFYNGATDLRSSYRTSYPDATRDAGSGARCVRGLFP